MTENTFKISANSSFLLDLIRFLAAEMVVVGHGIYDFNLFNKLPSCLPFQDLAVLIFFILSGFLISYTVLAKMRQREYTFKEYFVDRFSRIYSAYLPCLILIFLIDLAARAFLHIEPNPFTFKVKTFFANIFMLQDYPVLLHLKYYLLQDKDSALYVSVFGSGRPLWSIAVEWWLYMFYGWLLLKTNFKNISYYLILLFFAIVPIYNLIFGLKTEGLTSVWFMGCMITLALQKNYNFKKLGNGFLAFFFFITGLAAAFIYHNGYSMLTAIAFTFALYFAMKYFNEKKFSINQILSKAVHTGANFSFSLYLIHYSFIYIFNSPSLSMHVYTRFLLYFAASNLVAFIIAYGTEFNHRALAGYIKNKIHLT